MELPEAVVAGLFSLRDQSPDVEVCGIVGTNDLIYPFTNVAANSESCFVFSPDEWLLFKQLEIPIKAIYHSHPGSDATPSEADLQCLRRHQCDGLIITAISIEVIRYAD